MTKFIYTYNGYKLMLPGGATAAVPDPSFSVSPTFWPYSTNENTKSFNVLSSIQNEWDVSSNPSWVQIKSKTNQSGGPGSFDTSVYYNSGSTRTGQIVLKSRFLPQGAVIDVSQGTFAGAMTIAPSSYAFEPAGENKYFGVTSNFPWDVSSNPAWVTINNKSGQSGNGYFYGNVAQNAGAWRSGNIVMKCTLTPNLYPAGVVVPVSQDTYVPPRSMEVQFSGYPLYYSDWDSINGYCCSPDYGQYTLYLNVICSGSDAWYTNWSPNNATWYSYPSSYSSGSYYNFYVQLNNYSDDNSDLIFYWQSDNTVAYTISFSSYAFC